MNGQKAPLFPSNSTIFMVPVAVAALSTMSAFMDQDIKAPKLSGTAKLDATTEAAYAIIDKRVLDRESKTAKLRALRLEKEAVERAANASKSATKLKRKKADPVA
ncbi:hypothetical protein [Rhizobium sp. Root1203]|uniref:hypothetical protein n=1 Tax=Rhizobium sp. Root1203 TaxID=1736427 RepID=UPI000AE0B5C9|nr:hypothetical protein [Rhizobium sp. Root1203]